MRHDIIAIVLTVVVVAVLVVVLLQLSSQHIDNVFSNLP